MTRAPRSTRVVPIVSLCCALFGARSFAQSSPPRSQGDVEQLLRIGVDFRQRGDDEAALESFRRAYELSQTPRVAAQLGLAEQSLGRWVLAEVHLTAALAGGDDPWVRRHRAVLQDALEVVHDQLGTLELVVRPNGARVIVNGEPIGTTPLTAPLRLRAGVVRVDVSAEGHASVRLDVPVAARAIVRETVELRDERPVTPVVAVIRQQVIAPIPLRPRLSDPPRPPPLHWTRARIAAATSLTLATVASLSVSAVALAVRDRAVGVHNDNPLCPVAPECAGPRADERAWTIGASVAIPATVVFATGATLAALLEFGPRAAAPSVHVATSSVSASWSGRW